MGKVYGSCFPTGFLRNSAHVGSRRALPGPPGFESDGVRRCPYPISQFARNRFASGGQSRRIAANPIKHGPEDEPDGRPTVRVPPTPQPPRRRGPPPTGQLEVPNHDERHGRAQVATSAVPPIPTFTPIAPIGMIASATTPVRPSRMCPTATGPPARFSLRPPAPNDCAPGMTHNSRATSTRTSILTGLSMAVSGVPGSRSRSGVESAGRGTDDSATGQRNRGCSKVVCNGIRPSARVRRSAPVPGLPGWVLSMPSRACCGPFRGQPPFPPRSVCSITNGRSRFRTRPPSAAVPRCLSASPVGRLRSGRCDPRPRRPLLRTGPNSRLDFALGRMPSSSRSPRYEGRRHAPSTTRRTSRRGVRGGQSLWSPRSMGRGSTIGEPGELPPWQWESPDHQSPPVWFRDHVSSSSGAWHPYRPSARDQALVHENGGLVVVDHLRPARALPASSYPIDGSKRTSSRPSNAVAWVDRRVGAPVFPRPFGHRTRSPLCRV